MERHLWCPKDMENQFSNETLIVDGKIRERCRGVFNSSRRMTLWGSVHDIMLMTLQFLVYNFLSSQSFILMQGPKLI